MRLAENKNNIWSIARVPRPFVCRSVRVEEVDDGSAGVSESQSVEHAGKAHFKDKYVLYAMLRRFGDVQCPTMCGQ
jgi:hypothetical protein